MFCTAEFITRGSDIPNTVIKTIIIMIIKIILGEL